jgi:hypothetical protein
MGCVSSVVQDAIDAADERVRMKWAEEWKPALIAEVKNSVAEGKDQVLEEMVRRLEAYDDRLEDIGVDIRSHDTDLDGRIQLNEMYSLVKDIKEKNEKAPQPLSWYEIAIIVAGAYLPTTAVKEGLKSRMKNSGKAA